MSIHSSHQHAQSHRRLIESSPCVIFGPISPENCQLGPVTVGVPDLIGHPGVVRFEDLIEICRLVKFEPIIRHRGYGDPFKMAFWYDFAILTPILLASLWAPQCV